MCFLIFSYLFFLLKDRNSSSLPVPNIILLILIKSGLTRLLPREISHLVLTTTIMSRVKGNVVLRRLWSETQNFGFVNCNFRLRALAFQSF